MSVQRDNNTYILVIQIKVYEVEEYLIFLCSAWKERNKQKRSLSCPLSCTYNSIISLLKHFKVRSHILL